LRGSSFAEGCRTVLGTGQILESAASVVVIIVLVVELISGESTIHGKDLNCELKKMSTREESQRSRGRTDLRLVRKAIDGVF
jgi:hypothetical protein